MVAQPTIIWSIARDIIISVHRQLVHSSAGSLSIGSIASILPSESRHHSTYLDQKSMTMMSASASRSADNDDDNYMGEKLSAPPDFNGPTSRRHFTDILCTLLLWAMWISMTGLGIYAMQRGDYRLILYPLDYAGNRKWFVTLSVSTLINWKIPFWIFRYCSSMCWTYISF